MKNKILFALAFLSLISLVSAQDCFPNYVCGEWSGCQDGIQSRTCVDEKCGNRDIVERDFCEIPGCRPEIQCSAWSQCFYTEKTNNLINGKVKFGGYRNRVCEDTNGCVESFIQEGTCEESYDLVLKEVEECDQVLLSVIDPTSEREIAKINLDSWQENRLDLSFVQGSTKYCPSCYDAVQGGDETGVDCGGSCQPCKTESRTIIYSVITILWAISLISLFLAIREIIKIKRPNKKVI